MKILVAHNLYQQPGGEDIAVKAEVRLLESHGHQVIRYERHNDDIKGRSALGAIKLGIETIYSSQSFREVKELVKTEKPDVAHFHNTFPLISPSAYYACADFGVPVVQTLHNYRLVCPAATFLRDGNVCEECLGRSVAWPAVAHGCYRGNRAATSATAAMIAGHKIFGTRGKAVSQYIALTEFARHKFIDGGLPAERVVVKPNFVEPDPGPKQVSGQYALFAGRLSDEKGVYVLLGAWAQLRQTIPLKIAGDGPLRPEMARQIRESGLEGIELLGHVSQSDLVGLFHGARFLVFPSIWYEGFPLVIVEAFACGVPVIASRLGAMEEIIEDGRTGIHFSPHDSTDLSTKAQWAWNHDDEMNRLGLQARAQFERKYTAKRNYDSLMAVYLRAAGQMGGTEEITAAYRPKSNGFSQAKGE